MPAQKIPATALVVEQLGGVSYVYAEGTNGESITVQEEGHSKVANGTEIMFGVNPETGLLFDGNLQRI